ncbi:hypothetical protein HMPREF9440_00975, partial [Sutterella parvirubra YIT 11816]
MFLLRLWRGTLTPPGVCEESVKRTARNPGRSRRRTGLPKAVRFAAKGPEDVRKPGF